MARSSGQCIPYATTSCFAARRQYRHDCHACTAHQPYEHARGRFTFSFVVCYFEMIPQRNQSTYRPIEYQVIIQRMDPYLKD